MKKLQQTIPEATKNDLARLLKEKNYLALLKKANHYRKSNKFLNLYCCIYIMYALIGLSNQKKMLIKNNESSLQTYQLIQKSSLLLNAALSIYKNHIFPKMLSKNAQYIQNSLCESIHHLEQYFIVNILGKKGVLTRWTEAGEPRDKKILNILRAWAKNKIVELDQWLKENRLQKVESLYMKRAQIIFDINSKINDILKKYLCKLIDDCIEIIGVAPCDFSFILFGSLAKNSASLESDIELGILIDDDIRHNAKNKGYFRKLSTLLLLKVQRLGESAIPISDDGEDEDIDDITGFGFQFDLGGKHPLGRHYPKRKEQLQKIFENKLAYEDGYSLICTSSEMVRLLDEKYFILDKHLPKILLTHDHLYSREGENNETIKKYLNSKENPEGRVYQVYKRQKNEFLQRRSKKNFLTLYQLYVLQLAGSKFLGGYNDRVDIVESDLDLIKPSSKIKPGDIAASSDGYSINTKFIKDKIYRFSGLLIDHLAMWFNITTLNTWKQIEALQKIACFDLRTANNLKICWAIGIELRLRISSYNPGQLKKSFALCRQRLEFKGMLSMFYRIAIPFFTTIRQFIKHQNHVASSLNTYSIALHTRDQRVSHSAQEEYHESHARGLLASQEWAPQKYNQFLPSYRDTIRTLLILGRAQQKTQDLGESTEPLESGALNQFVGTLCKGYG